MNKKVFAIFSATLALLCAPCASAQIDPVQTGFVSLSKEQVEQLAADLKELEKQKMFTDELKSQLYTAYASSLAYAGMFAASCDLEKEWDAYIQPVSDAVEGSNKELFQNTLAEQKKHLPSKEELDEGFFAAVKKDLFCECYQKALNSEEVSEECNNFGNVE